MTSPIIYDAILGPAIPGLGWVPAPRYLLRRARILGAIRSIGPCRTLEIGCGPGILLHELERRGHQCTALESSPAALETANSLAEATGSKIDFRSSSGPDLDGAFQLVMAFEVLEHIEADVEALKQWAGWLQPGGTLMLSVPAHQRRWNSRDVFAGHVRRYERADLLDKVQAAGLQIEAAECYGFPLANILERASDRRHRASGTEAVDDSSRDDNTANSGVDRSRDLAWFPLLRSLPGKIAMQLAVLAQAPFLSTELGNGYFIRARKPA